MDEEPGPSRSVVQDATEAFEHTEEAGPSSSVKWSRLEAEPSGEVLISSDSRNDDRLLLAGKTAKSWIGDSRSKDEDASLRSYHSSSDETYEVDSDSDDEPEPATSSNAISFRFHGRNLEKWGNWLDRPGVVSKSREAQERQLENDFNRCVELLEDNMKEDAFLGFLEITRNPLVAQCKVRDLSSFDWKAARSKNSRFLSVGARVYLATNLALAQLSPEPVPFYLQALTIGPNSVSLWHMCGTAAAQKGDWAAAEFAYEQCGNDFRAWEALALLYYVSRQLEKCLYYCRLILETEAGHAVAILLLEEIEASGSPWQGAVAQMREEFPVKQLDSSELDDDLRGKILHKIKSFRHRQRPKDTGCLWRVCGGVAPLTDSSRIRKVPLSEDATMEEISKLLVAASRRTRDRSSSVLQKVSFVVPSSLPAPRPKVHQVVDNGEPIVIDHRAADSTEVTDEDIVNDIVKTMLNRIERIDARDNEQANVLGDKIVVDSSRMTGKPAKGAMKRKEGQPPPLAPKKPRKTTPVVEKSSKDKATESEEISRRRSTRFVEEIDDFVYQPNRRSNDVVHCDLLTAMGIDASVCPTAPPPLEEASVVHEEQPDTVDVPEFVGTAGLRDLMLQDDAKSIEDWLLAFLTWVSKQYAKLTPTQAHAYKSVYRCWVSTYLDFTEDADRSVDELQIHLVAGELGCHSGVKYLAKSLARRLSPKSSPAPEVQANSPYGTVAYKPSVVRNSGEVEMPMERSNGALMNVAIVGPSAPDYFKPLDPMALFDHIHARVCAGQTDAFAALTETPTSVRETFPPEKRDAQQKADDEFWAVIDDMGKHLTIHDDDSASRKVTSLETRSEALLQMRHLIGCSEDSDDSELDETLLDVEPLYDVGVPLADNEDTADENLRHLLLRYHWLIGHLDDATFQKLLPTPLSDSSQHLEEVTCLLKRDEKVFCHLGGSRQCISLRNSLVSQSTQVRENFSKRIEQLKLEGHLYEIEHILLDGFEWTSVDENKRMEYMCLLIDSLRVNEKPGEAANWILRLLHLLLPAEDGKTAADKCFARCLHTLTEFKLSEFDEQKLCEIGVLLAKFALNGRWKASTALWKACYCIAQHREGDLTEAYLRGFYSPESEIEFRLPTKALLVLMLGHEALGEAKKCDIEQGSFIRFYLEALGKAMNHPIVRELFRKDKALTVEVRDNSASEAVQCLICLCGETLPRGRLRYEDHRSGLRHPADWALAQHILPLVLPVEMPLFDDKRKIPSDTLEILQRYFKFIGEASDEATADFDKFCSSTPALHLQPSAVRDEAVDMNNPPFGDQYLPDDPESIRWPSAPLPSQQEEVDRLGLSAKVLYALAVSAYRNAQHEDYVKFAKLALINGAHSLSSELMASAWAMVARGLGHEVMSSYDDRKLLHSVDLCLFPFKMSLYLKKDTAELHLDLGSLMYQIRTRLKRFAARKGTDIELKEKAHRITIDFLPISHAHFLYAIHFNKTNQAVEITWVAEYFLGKVAEKRDAPPETILGLYYRSAVTMEGEDYTYPTRIHRIKQVNIEPLEIHYRVHVCALKFLRKLREKRLPCSSAECLRRLRVIYEYLKVFSGYGVAKKGASSAQSFYDTSKCQQLTDTEVVNSSDDAELENLVTDVADIVDYAGQVERMCRMAFEAILYKFPHYKATLRLAQINVESGDVRAGLNILWNLFTGNKKTEPATMFENVTEIMRSDIDHSGAFAYHNNKITELAISSAFKACDLQKLTFFCIGLTKHKDLRALSERDARLCKTASVCALSFLVRELLREEDLEVLKPKYALVDNVVRLLRRRSDETLATVEPHAKRLTEKIIRMEHARQQVFKPQVSSVAAPLAAHVQAAQPNPSNGHAVASSSPAIARSPVQIPPHPAANMSNGATPSVPKVPRPHQAHSSAPKVTATHAIKRPTPDKTAAPLVKQKRVENRSPPQTAAFDIRNLQNVLTQLSPDVHALFTDALTRSELSLGGKRQLLKSFMELHAKNELNAQSFRLMFIKIVERERKEESVRSSAAGASRAPTPGALSTHPITLTDSPDRSAKSSRHVAAEQSSNAVIPSSSATRRPERDDAVGRERPLIVKAQPKPPTAAVDSSLTTISATSKVEKLKILQIQQQQRLQMQKVNHAPVPGRPMPRFQSHSSPRPPTTKVISSGSTPPTSVQPHQNLTFPIPPSCPPTDQNAARAKPDTPATCRTEEDERLIRLVAEKYNISPSKLSYEQLARMSAQRKTQPHSSSSSTVSGPTQRLHKVQEKAIAKLPRAQTPQPHRTPPRMVGNKPTMPRKQPVFPSGTSNGNRPPFSAANAADTSSQPSTNGIPQRVTPSTSVPSNGASHRGPVKPQCSPHSTVVYPIRASTASKSTIALSGSPYTSPLKTPHVPPFTPVKYFDSTVASLTNLPTTPNSMTAFLQSLSPETKRFLNQNAQQPSSSATLNPSVVAALWNPVCHQMAQASSNVAMSSLHVPHQNATYGQNGANTAQAPTVPASPPRLPPNALSLAHQALMQQFCDLRQKLNLPKP